MADRYDVRYGEKLVGSRKTHRAAMLLAENTASGGAIVRAVSGKADKAIVTVYVFRVGKSKAMREVIAEYTTESNKVLISTGPWEKIT